jgi:hypothetical protein
MSEGRKDEKDCGPAGAAAGNSPGASDPQSSVQSPTERTIKVLKTGDMKWTPFGMPEGLAFLAERGIVLVEDPRQADVAVCEYIFPRWSFLKLRYGDRIRTFLCWTNEPRYDTTFGSIRKTPFYLPDVHVMNVYTGDVFLHNWTLMWHVGKQLPPFSAADYPHRRSVKMVALMTCRLDESQRLMKDGRDLDLNRLRCRIALEGHQAGLVDIYGRDWPPGVSREDSRERRWRRRKQEILQPYWFNLAMENTNYDYYCTEKIWDSIEAGCLPIYYGRGNRIYETFPRGSFLDAADFATTADLLAAIQGMTTAEFATRMNLCIDTFNCCAQKAASESRWSQTHARLLEKIRTLAGLQVPPCH